jgi:hypothetical protein
MVPPKEALRDTDFGGYIVLLAEDRVTSELVRHDNQNGCDAILVTSGDESKAINQSRSSHDSYPTCVAVVADHHNPGKLR